MKKVLEWMLFAAIIVVLPGGVLLAVKKLAQRLKGEFLIIAAMMAFSACIPYFKYEVKEPGKYLVAKGHILDVPEALRAAGDVERQRAEAKCIEKNGVAGCYGYGGWYGVSGLPAGYTVGARQAYHSPIRANERMGAGAQAQKPQAFGDNSLAEVVRGQKETNIYLKALASSQEKFQRALVKNRKRGKR